LKINKLGYMNKCTCNSSRWGWEDGPCDYCQGYGECEGCGEYEIDCICSDEDEDPDAFEQDLDHYTFKTGETHQKGN